MLLSSPIRTFAEGASKVFHEFSFVFVFLDFIKVSSNLLLVSYKLLYQTWLELYNFK